MPAFTQHIFVCGNQRNCDHARGCCDPDGQNALRNALKATLKAKSANVQSVPLARVNSAGCLDQCELGPAIVIYPQGIWYGGVQLSDVPRIADSILNGTVVDDLVIADELLNTKGQGTSAAKTSNAATSVAESVSRDGSKP